MFRYKGVCLILIQLVLSGCGDRVSSSVDYSREYPVSAVYGRKTLQEFVGQHCGGAYDLACERQYIGHFGQKLIEHYNQTHHSLTVCQWNIVLCMNDHVFEDHVRNWGKI